MLVHPEKQSFLGVKRHLGEVRLCAGANQCLLRPAHLSILVAGMLDTIHALTHAQSKAGSWERQGASTISQVTGELRDSTLARMTVTVRGALT